MNVNVAGEIEIPETGYYYSGVYVKFTDSGDIRTWMNGGGYTNARVGSHCVMSGTGVRTPYNAGDVYTWYAERPKVTYNPQVAGGRVML
eukprot:Pgem_evm1s19002